MGLRSGMSRGRLAATSRIAPLSAQSVGGNAGLDRNGEVGIERVAGCGLGGSACLGMRARFEHEAGLTHANRGTGERAANLQLRISGSVVRGGPTNSAKAEELLLRSNGSATEGD
eukprot:11946275-Alexandrium_andersonii.AAC.1